MAQVSDRFLTLALKLLDMQHEMLINVRNALSNSNNYNELGNRIQVVLSDGSNFKKHAASIMYEGIHEKEISTEVQLEKDIQVAQAMPQVPQQPLPIKSDEDQIYQAPSLKPVLAPNEEEIVLPLGADVFAPAPPKDIVVPKEQVHQIKKPKKSTLPT